MLNRAADGRYRVEADLTFATAAGLRPQGLAALAAAPGTEVTFDLAGVRRVDSAGLAVLVDWLAAARVRGAQLHLAGPPPELRALARLSDVESLLVGAG